MNYSKHVSHVTQTRAVSVGGWYGRSKTNRISSRCEVIYMLWTSTKCVADFTSIVLTICYSGVL